MKAFYENKIRNNNEWKIQNILIFIIDYRGNPSPRYINAFQKSQIRQQESSRLSKSGGTVSMSTYKANFEKITFKKILRLAKCLQNVIWFVLLCYVTIWACIDFHFRSFVKGGKIARQRNGVIVSKFTPSSLEKEILMIIYIACNLSSFSFVLHWWVLFCRPESATDKWTIFK